MLYLNIQKDFESGLFYQKDILVKYNISIKRLRTLIKKGLLDKKKFKLKKYEASIETKEKISTLRKNWLKSNPDKHPWRNKSKSIPCEKFKEFLNSKKIFFIEEVLISKERFYSVDILIPQYNSVVEINGNQHYEATGLLKKYYNDRNFFIKSKGWNVYEIHYSLVYNLEYCESILNSILNNKNLELPFFIKSQKKSKYKNREDYWNNRKKNKLKKYEEKIKILKNSNIDFYKFGWVKLASKILEVKNPGKLLSEIDPEFYKNCYKRK